MAEFHRPYPEEFEGTHPVYVFFWIVECPAMENQDVLAYLADGSLQPLLKKVILVARIGWRFCLPIRPDFSLNTRQQRDRAITWNTENRMVPGKSLLSGGFRNVCSC
jgi:hypothetical protein